jgi:hypothetical protein
VDRLQHAGWEAKRQIDFGVPNASTVPVNKNNLRIDQTYIITADIEMRQTRSCDLDMVFAVNEDRKRFFDPICLTCRHAQL